MKKILIINNNLHIGGVQRALVNLLQQIAGEVDVSLLLFYDGGELRSSLPSSVHVLTACRPLRYWGMTSTDAASASDRLLRAFWAGLVRILGRKLSFRLAALFQPRINGFDAVISYLHSGNEHVFYGGCNEFALYCTEAARKITFLHCDYAKIHAHSPYNTSIYSRFDRIAACSDGCRSAFVQLLPQLASRTYVVPNCHNYDAVRLAAARSPVHFSTDAFHVVTVSRLGKEKGVVRAIQALRDLGDLRDRIHYTVVGSGSEEASIRSLIRQYGLQNTVTLVPETANPHGYIQAADLLLIPSYSEAAPMVIGEAACLGTPVLTTETSSAKEMVADTGYGWVCENSMDGIRSALKDLLSAPEEVLLVKTRLSKMTFQDAAACSSFIALLRE